MAGQNIGIQQIHTGEEEEDQERPENHQNNKIY